jgi:hypothetical protein
MDLAAMPAATLFDSIYALVCEDTKEAKEHREKLDELLDRSTPAVPDRATWGKLPHQQRAMRAATQALG